MENQSVGLYLTSCIFITWLGLRLFLGRPTGIWIVPIVVVGTYAGNGLWLWVHMPLENILDWVSKLGFVYQINQIASLLSPLIILYVWLALFFKWRIQQKS